jgi:hypothetical protein
MDYDIVIAGCGISGLKFLELLLSFVAKSQPKKKLKVLLMDKKDRLGGRITTFCSPANKDQGISKYSMVFEGGPSRFSERHTELLKILERLKLKTSEIGAHTTPSSPGVYMSLRVPYKSSLDSDRKELSNRIMKEYGLDKDTRIVKFLSTFHYDSGEIYTAITKWMTKDFKVYPSWRNQFSGVSFLKFRELLLFYLVCWFEIDSKSHLSQTSLDAIQIKYKIEQIKLKQLGATRKRPESLLESFAKENQEKGLAVLEWLCDALGYSAELEMSAPFGIALVNEVTAPQKWYVLEDKQSQFVGGLHGFISFYFRVLLNVSKKLKDYLKLDVSLGQEIREIQSSKGKWILKCSSIIKARISSFGCKDFVFTGSNLNLEAILPRRELEKSGQVPSQNKIPTPILFNYIYRSIQPRALLRVFVKFPPVSKDRQKYWFDGVPRIISSGPLRMIIPMQAGKYGVYQVSYTDYKYATPWFALLDSGKLDGTVKPPNPINMDFGYAKPNSKFGIEIFSEIQKQFPEIKIPRPLMLVYHPCICHYAEPETSESMEAANNNLNSIYGDTPFPDITYKDLGRESYNPLKGLYLCGEAYNNHENTQVPTGWMESAIRSALQAFQIWEKSGIGTK